MLHSRWQSLPMLCVSVAASALRGPSAHAAVPTTAHATVCDVKTCGATGDGHTLDTAALQLAIDHVSQIGGGTIDVPPGHYLTGTLILRDHTTLHLAAGAMLIGSTDIADYRNGADVGQPLPTSPYAQDESAFKALLLAVNAHDIAVTGDGTIDGRGAAVAAAIHQLQVEQKIPGNPKARPDESLRPRILNFVSCRNVRVAGVTLRDSACWVQNYTNCNGLTVDHVTVRSQAFWNNDGIDLTGCQHVRATHLDIDAADDGICLKSNATPCDDLLIQHCKVRSWANAIKFGNVSFQAFRHVTIDHVDVTGSGHAGLSIESVDGAIVDGITVSNVTLRNLRAGILIKLGDRHAPNGQTGAIRNVTLTHVTAELADGDPDAGQTFHAPVPSYKHNPFPCVISGLPDHPIENVVLRDVTFHTPGGGTAAVASVPLDQLQGIRENSKGYPEYSMHGELPAFGWFVRHAAAVTMGDVQVRCGQPDFRSAVVFDDVSALDVSALRITNPGGEGPVVALNRVHGATIRGDVATTTATAYLKSLTDCTAVTAADNVLHPTRAQGAAHGGTPE